MITKEQIAKANDLLRQTMIRSPRHKVILSEGVAMLQEIKPLDFQLLIGKVIGFEDFTEANDPHGEHDFGKVIVGNTSFYFKIDYYDDKFEYGADPTKGPVNRIITIMESSEY